MIKLDDILARRERICVVGLGYVGLPLAIALSRHFDVIGFDINERRISELRNGTDRTGEVSSEEIRNSGVTFSSEVSDISRCGFVIVAVPTPVDSMKNPDFKFLKHASGMVGKNLKKGSVVVFESTVYPGATRNICVPILERESGLVWKRDFFVGYSPERVNPGDRQHTIDKVTKIVAGDTPETLEVVAGVYGKITDVYKAESIEIAEAAKVIENVQRDINIALMNEFSIIFRRLGLDTKKILSAARTKWNFLPFEPGLVGGHCIPVDPYYLAYRSQEVGYVPELILAGRRINEHMPMYIASEIVRLLIRSEKKVKGAKILVMGVTFKENVSDIRNSKVFDLVKELVDFGAAVYIYDPMADSDEIEAEYPKEIYGYEILNELGHDKYDCVAVAVRHRVFLENLSPELIRRLSTDPPILVDIKGAFEREVLESMGMIYWSM